MFDERDFELSETQETDSNEDLFNFINEDDSGEDNEDNGIFFDEYENALQAIEDYEEDYNIDALAVIERGNAIGMNADAALSVFDGDPHKPIDTPELDQAIERLNAAGFNTSLEMDTRIKTLMRAWDMDVKTAYKEVVKEMRDSDETAPKRQNKLSRDELSMAKIFGMTPEEYARNKR